MAELSLLSPEEIRIAQQENDKLRARDLATKLGLSEAQLVAAQCGLQATRISAHPDQVMAAAQTLGEVMALTRNDACVHEKVGCYDNYHPGAHAAMVLTEEIDLRIFPSHWQHAFMLEAETESGTRRSIQVFDAAGDAIHKIFLREASRTSGWNATRSELALDDQSQTLNVVERKPPEAPKSDPGKLDILQREWRRMTDTHQFLRLVSKLKMNRLGAYRIAGGPFVRELAPESIDTLLHALAERALDIMLFVGNRGCIQIHTGPIHTLRPMGPWQNVMDPGFNLHLRLDKIAEVWAVEKPTQRGPAVSVEAFDDQGGLIFQIFGVGKEGRDSRPAWGELVETLPTRESAQAVPS
ncbi:hemin-degrading factor [Thalassococcus sp. S3]|uniref:hemin-degrading factor n=1 Tax=Thalassococcus sp. S3 TaxID=2017482 RepID=UPI00102490AC|nr:ChuX/HutX family heme-like substrate-binding protein [Thalassococcus sp. S3]QBF30457.1 hemin-degrading factor [Thalassococcus sp. S3]